MKKNILCFETSNYIKDAIKSELSEECFNLHFFSSGLEGLEKLYSIQPSIIIMNPVLGDINGVDILHFLKSNSVFSKIPVILYSTITDQIAELFFDQADILLYKDSCFTLELAKIVNNLELENCIITGIALSVIEIAMEIENISFYNQVKTNMLGEILFIAMEITNYNLLQIEIENFYDEHFNSKENISDSFELNLYHYFEKISNFLLERAREYQNNIILGKNLNNLFENFLPKKVISDLIKKEDISSLMTGENREIAVLFSHIKDFSVIENSNSVTSVVDFLNYHFTGISNGIRNFGGEINKFIGDAVFAMFGAPESYDDNETRACDAAIDMLKFISESKNYSLRFGDNGYRIGIGIHIGKAIIGNIGSKDNFDFTAIGDTINLAARLESLCKYYDRDILVSSEIKDGCYLKKYNGKFREIDTVLVKGKNEPTTIFSLEDTSLYPDCFLDNYNKGLMMFKLGNWIIAKEYFIKCDTIFKGDRVLSIYLDRCSRFISDPPAEWIGAITLDFK